jgi:hypothetical protein
MSPLNAPLDRFVKSSSYVLITATLAAGVACGEDGETPRQRWINGVIRARAAETKICVDRGGVPIMATTDGFSRMVRCDFPPVGFRLER